MNRKRACIGCCLAPSLAVAILCTGLYLWWWPGFIHSVEVGSVREQGAGLAEFTMDFYQKNHRLPRSLQELPAECQGWVSSTVEDFSPDFRLDPRSNGDRACVWLRPKKGVASGEWRVYRGRVRRLGTRDGFPGARPLGAAGRQNGGRKSSD